MGVQHSDIDHTGITGVGGGAVAAEDVTITDTGAYFTGTDVEAALQELGASGGGGSGGSDDPVADQFGAADTAYEFDSSSLAGWTQLGSNSATVEDSDTTIDSHYYQYRTANNNVQWVGRYRAMPTPPFTIIAKQFSYPIAQYQGAGIFVGVTTPGATEAIIHSGEQARRVSTEIQNPTTPLGTINAHGSLLWIESPLYFAIRVNTATDVDFLYSVDGKLWRTVTNARTPGTSIASGSMGMMMKVENASFSMAAAWDYFRVWNSALAMPGSD